MNGSRIIANNINLELRARTMEFSEFVNELGISLTDAHKLIEGRLFVPPNLLKEIADILGITKERLLQDRGMAEYNSLIHNFRGFKKEKNQELVLDLIDMYADLCEAL